MGVSLPQGRKYVRVSILPGGGLTNKRNSCYKCDLIVISLLGGRFLQNRW